MCFVPANRHWALDARRNPAMASNTVPNWTRIWFASQIEVVLIYAGLVKLNWDWLNLEPMRLWMTEKSSQSHAVFQWLTQDPGIAVASYGVLFLHILGAPLLLWKKTRLAVFVLYCIFHLINAFVFNIGIFPFLTIAATLMFFDPSWPRQFAHWCRGKVGKPAKRLDAVKSAPNFTSGLVIVGITLWLIAQILIPLRHFTIPGDVAWNEAGHKYSWRMKLRDKRGETNFYVSEDGGQAKIEDYSERLSRRQVFYMKCNPDLIWQYANYIEHYRTEMRSKKNIETKANDIKVYVDARCSLNTRDSAPLINRLVDLTGIERDEPVQNWVLPLNKTLPKKFLPI